MAKDIYRAEEAAADLAGDRLLEAVLVSGPTGPVRLAPQERPVPLNGGFAGAGLDSRSLEPGQLFVALPGAKVDGRSFIPQVLSAGHWILADGADLEAVGGVFAGEPWPAGTGVLLTRRPTAALACLAKAWRRRLDVMVAGVTGTNGKTTTKDLLAAMLRGAGPTLATAGNFNNQLGLPLTLLGLNSTHRFAVVEMGASAVGDIAQLAPLAAPQTGIITNAAPAHLARFGSLEDIIRGKGELLDALPADGCAILNADSPGFAAWQKRARCPVVSFGRSGADQVWRWLPPDAAAGPRVEVDGRTWPVPLPGEHNGANLCAALLAARSFGLTAAAITAGLTGFSGSAHRGVLLEIGGRQILDDSYNANPVSMVTAGQALGRLPGAGRCVAVLGAMAELGPASAAIHEKTGRQLADGPVDLLIVVGKKARPLGEGFDAAGGVVHYGEDLKEAAALAALYTRAGDRLLVKGSRSEAMEDLLPLLTAAFGNH
jgi:UDP-N-acetylmuramoyl-tripeptide--D-alanyl-D-alanine ligase